jgi:hypothetical protein
VKQFKSYLWPAVVGLLLGWLLDPGIIREKLYDFHDWLNPVAEIYATSVPSPDRSLRFLMYGTKFRDCELESVLAYDVNAIPVERIRLTVTRVDGAHSTQHDIGPFKGTVPWTIAPPALGKLELYSRHMCDDRHVITPIIIK